MREKIRRFRSAETIPERVKKTKHISRGGEAEVKEDDVQNCGARREWPKLTIRLLEI